jgi:iron complex outermembrane recepter protein
MNLTATRTVKLAALCTTALALFATATPAFAQASDEEGAEGREVIIVTARKRAEDIQTVPIAISAYTAQELAERNITNFADLGNSTPGLNVTSIAGGTTQQIFVRGLAPANTTTDLNVEANVGTFIDGIYQTSRNTLDIIAVLDVDQIEVAKWPQSALFGRSTFAGALSIRTRRPRDEMTADIALTAGADKDFRVKGSIAGPLTDTLSARVSGGFLTYDGWGRNLAATGDNLGGTEKYAVSASLKWEPSPNFTATLAGFLTDSKTEMTPATQVALGAFNCGTTSASAVTLGLRQQYCGPLVASKDSDISPGIPETTAKTRQISLELEAKLGGVRLVSVTGFTGAENRAYNDYDASSAGVLLGVCTVGNAFNATCGSNFAPAPYTRLVRTNFVSIGLEKVRTFSQELRIQSDNDSPFQWLIGANYFDQKIPVAAGGVGADRAGLLPTERFVQVTQIGVVPTAGVGAYEFTANPFTIDNSNVGQVSSSWAKASTQTYSIFGSLGYRLGKLRVTAEGRYNWDKKRAQVFSVLNLASAPGVNQPITGTDVPAAGLFPVSGPEFNKTFESFAPRFTVDFQATREIFLYASAAKGVRAGGFNTANAVSPTGILASEVPYDEEKNWTYELGFKTTLFDRRLLLNASYFHVDWSNAQVSSFTENPTAVNPVRIIRNIGEIKSDGFEVQAEFKASDMFSFGGSLAYSDVKFGPGTYDGGTVTQCVVGAGATATAAPGCPPLILVSLPSGQVRAVPALEGLRPQRSVKWQWNLHASAEFDVSDSWKAAARVDVNHTGPSFGNLINTITFGQRTLTNARLTFSNERFGISLWGTNIFDKVYVQNTINQPRAGLPFAFVVPEVYLGEGRRFGVTLTAKY